jgi:hypothetical protein
MADQPMVNLSWHSGASIASSRPEPFASEKSREPAGTDLYVTLLYRIMSFLLTIEPQPI